MSFFRFNEPPTIYTSSYFSDMARRLNAIFSQDAQADTVGAGIASAGTTQADAVQLNNTINQVTSNASGAGVILPIGFAADQVIVVNASGNALLVYPTLGATINFLSANAAYSLSSHTVGTFVAVSKSQWYST